MKAYKVNVNGTLYEITIEEADVNEVKGASSAPKAQVSSAASSSPANGEKITSPMPGNILDVKVSNGQAVKKGQVLMILEAMKMENEIMAPKDGKVASVNVSKGATVESGALLCVIE